MSKDELLQKMQESPQKPLKKDSGCVFCRHIFDCPGKPPEVKLCVNFEERKRKNDDKTMPGMR